MKRINFILALAFFCGMANAQTQQGIVKTRGRMVDGQLVKGERLAGATITLNFGNPLVSLEEGSFSFSVPAAKTFSLVSATKQGYTLADPEYTQRSFTYSAQNPFYVVLEDEKQRLADINAATRKVRKTLLARLEKLEEEIETLKKQNKLTELEYQERLQQLYDNQSNSEKLIKEMAERYATTDYDQLDEFNRQVQMYIEEGELQKADSLIRSKGNMEQRVAEYRNVVDANKKIREELEQSESGAAKAYEDLSQDLYRRHEIFLQKFQQDSALYCLKTRADLDTTNMEAVFDYAELCKKQKKFTESEKYYLICLRLSIRNDDLLNTAAIQNNLGILSRILHDYINSERYYILALENYEQLFHQDSNTYRKNLAMTQNNLGNLYSLLKDFANSKRYFKLALQNREVLFKQDPDTHRADLACTQNNLGLLYEVLQEFETSEKYYKLALENKEHLFMQNPEVYLEDLTTTQNNLGIFYCRIEDFENGERYLKLALENTERLFKQNPDKYQDDLAMTQNNLGNLYSFLNDFANSKKYYLLAIDNRKQLFRRNPNVYKEDLAMTQNNLSFLFANANKFDDAIEAIDEAISLTPDIADFYDTKGEILLMQGKNAEALEMWKKVQELNPNFLNDHPDGTNLSNGLKALGLIE